MRPGDDPQFLSLYVYRHVATRALMGIPEKRANPERGRRLAFEDRVESSLRYRSQCELLLVKPLGHGYLRFRDATSHVGDRREDQVRLQRLRGGTRNPY